MIKVQGAGYRHAVIWGQYQFRSQAANRAGGRDDDQLVDVAGYRVSSEYQYRTALVGAPKRVPPDFASPHSTSSQPSASQASGSSWVENSSAPGGAAR